MIDNNLVAGRSWPLMMWSLLPISVPKLVAAYQVLDAVTVFLITTHCSAQWRVFLWWAPVYSKGGAGVYATFPIVSCVNLPVADTSATPTYLNLRQRLVSWLARTAAKLQTGNRVAYQLPSSGEPLFPATELDCQPISYDGVLGADGSINVLGRGAGEIYCN